MGVEYYLFDKPHKRVLWLGKGRWPDRLVGAPKDQPPMVLRQRLRLYWPDLGDWTAEDDAWLSDLTAKIWAFIRTAGADIEFRSDATDYDDEGYDLDDPNGQRPIVISQYKGHRCVPDPEADQQARFEHEAAVALRDTP
jgi:hypothetical protein